MGTEIPEVGLRKRETVRPTLLKVMSGINHFSVSLTPSLRGCHLKATIKSVQFETIKPFCFLLRRHWHVK